MRMRDSAMAQLTLSMLASATQELASRDPELGFIVTQFGTPPLWGRRPGFATLVRIILAQQVSLASAETMFKRLRSTAGDVTPQRVSTMGARGLRGIGFTRQKAGYVHDLAASIQGGYLDLRAVSRASDADGMRTLLGVRGLGPWSVDIYFIMALRRPDVWPRGDLALATAVHQVKRLRARPDHDKLTRFAERWAPWRSVAARILWHHYLSTRMRQGVAVG